ncbi:MAG TPA: hypothetical protein VJ506_02855 [Candidatus Limnocylindrales bacterium]|nr:hypothetical protein [Candidatus Limnocylindrales bacterium]
MDLNWQSAATEDDPSAEPAPASPPDTGSAATPDPAQGAAAIRDRRRRRLASGATIAGALVVGGVAGAMMLGPVLAASPTPSSAPSSTSKGTHSGGPGMGGHVEAVSDTSVAAKAIGISEADLLTALNGGQTIAAVAKAHNVDPQKVIDALVADGKDELAAAVKAGTITQAQADAEQAEVVARATAQVNGTMRFGGPDGSH